MRIILLFLALLGAAAQAVCCTSAVVAGSLTESGRPMLWKNRDTSSLDNFVARVEPSDSAFGYVALFNKGDIALKEAWIGMNDAGFVIMNTQSYNLAPYPAGAKDREGILMTEALRRCTSVDDFARLLENSPRPLGVQANFGVIDAEGRGGYFETDERGFRFYALSDSVPLIVRTNFSMSGGEGGLGLVRYDNAVELLKPYSPERKLTPEVFTEELSRSFYRADIDRDFATETVPDKVADVDFIPRYSTSASVVITAGSPKDMVMWCALGYPPCARVYPATLTDIPVELRMNPTTGYADAAREADALKATVFRGCDSRGRHLILLPEALEISRRLKAENLVVYRQFYDNP